MAVPLPRVTRIPPEDTAHPTGLGLSTGQRAKGAGEPTVRVGVALRVRLSKHGSDSLAHVVIVPDCPLQQRFFVADLWHA